MESHEREGAHASSSYDYNAHGRSHLQLGPQIEKLLQQAADKERELLALLELTPTQIWNTDLDRFIEEWEVSGTTPVASRRVVSPCNTCGLG